MKEVYFIFTKAFLQHLSHHEVMMTEFYMGVNIYRWLGI